jgi:aryl-alcohol dehydrogenase-like predicted oxidoreductase
MDKRSRLALGTVQFGLAYGVSHAGGRLPMEEARAVIELAALSGVDMLDTAAAYGDSEAVVGDIAGPGSSFDIVTKTLPIRDAAIAAADVDRVEAAFHQSLRRLRRASVHALLVHDARDILNSGGELLWARLEALRDQGLTRKIGVSAYDRAEIDAVTSRFPIAILQAPLSAFDQRRLADGTFDRLSRRGVEIHARSVLMQGLLLMTPEAVKAKLPAAFAPLNAWRRGVVESGSSPLAAALGFALRQPMIDRAVIGVHSAAHLAECLAAAAQEIPPLDYARFACDDLDVIDPRRWAH